MVQQAAAAARREGLEAFRGVGADVVGGEVNEPIQKLRGGISAGAAPRNKAEVRRLMNGLGATVVRVALGSPDADFVRVADALWMFVEIGTCGAQAEPRVRQVAGDEAGWPGVVRQCRCRAVGELDQSEQHFDWKLHAGLGVALAGLLGMALAKTGRGRACASLAALVGVAALIRALPGQARSW